MIKAAPGATVSYLFGFGVSIGLREGPNLLLLLGRPRRGRIILAVILFAIVVVLLVRSELAAHGS